MRGTVFLRAEAMTSLLLSGGGAGRSVGRGGVIGCKPAAPRTNPQARYYQPSRPYPRRLVSVIRPLLWRGSSNTSAANTAAVTIFPFSSSTAACQGSDQSEATSFFHQRAVSRRKYSLITCVKSSRDLGPASSVTSAPSRACNSRTPFARKVLWRLTHWRIGPPAPMDRCWAPASRGGRLFPD